MQEADPTWGADRGVLGLLPATLLGWEVAGLLSWSSPLSLALVLGEHALRKAAPAVAASSVFGMLRCRNEPCANQHNGEIINYSPHLLNGNVRKEG